MVSTYGSNFRRRTVLLTDTFSNSRRCPLTRESSLIWLPTKSSLQLEHPNSHSCKMFHLSLSLSLRNCVFSFEWQANGIEVRPIISSIRKVRFLCNFTSLAFEKYCLVVPVFFKYKFTFGKKNLKEKNKFFWSKKNCKFQIMSIIVRRSGHLRIESQKYIY